jgi:riboflavin synthase
VFTGLVECTGILAALTPMGGDIRLQIDIPAAAGTGFCADIRTGDSICVAGVCLTALDVNAHSFCADVSTETLRLTSLGALKTGAPINLEKSLLPSTRLGGHFVSGHVDGLAVVQDIRCAARSQCWEFSAPGTLMRFIAVKGSVCIDGVSLTVNALSDDRFSVNLIPHTLEKTSLSERKVGDVVNLEVDLIARYLDRLRA